MVASSKVIIDDILPSQVRAARAMLGWTQDQLAAVSSLPKRTIARVELATGVPRGSTIGAIRTALEAAGVTFTNGDEPGVKLKRQVE